MCDVRLVEHDEHAPGVCPTWVETEEETAEAISTAPENAFATVLLMTGT
jgi:hypothetical protein